MQKAPRAPRIRQFFWGRVKCSNWHGWLVYPAGTCFMFFVVAVAVAVVVVLLLLLLLLFFSCGVFPLNVNNPNIS